MLKKSDKSDFIQLFKSDFIRLFKIRSTALVVNDMLRFEVALKEKGGNVGKE